MTFRDFVIEQFPTKTLSPDQEKSFDKVYCLLILHHSRSEQQSSVSNGAGKLQDPICLFLRIFYDKSNATNQNCSEN